MDYLVLSDAAAARAREVLAASGIADIWREAGAEVRLVGSLRMGLIAKHRDIDLHVYSSGITIESSFAVGARMAADPRVAEVKCINGLHTDERCVAWHVTFNMAPGETWQIDVIHIEAGSRYDGFFEQMADRIKARLDAPMREAILKLKFETPDGEEIHGVEYYEGVIDGGVRTLPELREWVALRRAKPFYYWMPD